MKGVLHLALSPRKLAQNWYTLFLFSKTVYTNQIIAPVPLNLMASLLLHCPQASNGAHTYMQAETKQNKTKHPYTYTFFFFETGFLCVALAVLELRNPPASASRVLGLKACTTTPGLSHVFLT